MNCSTTKNTTTIDFTEWIALY